MKKQIDISLRPKQNDQADAWVETQSAPSETKPQVKPKRLTIDIDPTLHSRLKVFTAQRGVMIADMMRDLIQRELDKDAGT